MLGIQHRGRSFEFETLERRWVGRDLWLERYGGFGLAAAALRVSLVPLSFDALHAAAHLVTAVL
eukprot:19125-Eustigmatos_ZCMA.PRE.1